MRVRRRVAALLALAAVPVTLLLTAAPALAQADESNDPAASYGTGLTLLILLGIPIGVFLLVALLVYAPSRLRPPRYRPGAGEWGYAPLWIGGPDDAQTALTRTPTDAVVEARGGGTGAGW